jgi:hypothetical protein
LKIEDVFAAKKRRAGWRFGESRKINKPRSTSPQRAFSPRRRVRASQEPASRSTVNCRKSLALGGVNLFEAVNKTSALNGTALRDRAEA